MPLKLRRTGSTFRLEIGGAGADPTVLIGRHLTHGELLKLTGRATKRGVLDSELLDQLFFEEALIGWERLYAEGADGGAPVEIPFEPKRAAEIGARLPEDAAALFTRRVREADWHFQEAEGNSSGSSAAASPTPTP